MPKRRNKTRKIDSEVEQAALHHAACLQINSLADYQHWCRRHGFSSKLDKSNVQRNSELDYYQRVQADRRIKQHSKESGLEFQLRTLSKVNPDVTAIANPIFRELAAGFRETKLRNDLLVTLLSIDQRSKLLQSADYAKAIVRCHKLKKHWLRDIDSWKPRTRSATRQFSSLLRHLFAHYEMPAFMDNAWLSGHADQQSWFIHMGRGENIRKAHNLPIAMTKNMAHHFSLAPEDYDAYAALRWSQVMTLGGRPSLAKAINETRLHRDFRDDQFWFRVIQFFVDNPMLDAAQVLPIVDYIWHQKYEPRVEFVERGVAQDLGPAQPNFSMRGRTPHVLLRQVEQWHNQLGREARGGHYQWRKSSIRDFKYSEGSVENGNQRDWTICELLSSHELIVEGRRQHHCVASYAHSCARGRTSIWTMDCSNRDTVKKQVTIEVRMADRTVCQIRGSRNRLATDAEMKVVGRWIAKENLKLSNYIAEY